MGSSRTVWLVVLAAALVAAGWWLWRPEAPEGPPPVELVRGNNAEPESLDPHRARSEPALNVLRDLYEGLTTLGPDGEVVPGVARTWSTSDDGLTWRFELDPESRWSDGRVLAAEDFAWAFRRLSDPQTGSPWALLLSPVAGVEAAVAGRAEPAAIGVAAEGPQRLVLRLSRPAPWLPAALAHPAASPLRRDVLERQDAAREARHVGNGAFRLAQWAVGSHLLLERNPHYARNAANALDQVRYLPIADHAAELSRYRAGELDMTYTVPVSRVEWLKEHLPEEFRISPYLAVYFYGFNTRRPPLDDPRVRRALSLAVDRELIAARVLGGGERPACSLVPPEVSGYAPPRGADCRSDHDETLAQARRLLAEAGYGPERPLTLQIRYNTGELHERIAVAIGALWEDQLGVTTKLVQEEFRVLLDRVRAGQATQVWRASWIADYDDPVSFLAILAGNSPVNGTGWSDPEYDRLLADAAQAREPEGRMALLAAAEARALAAAPVMPLYFYVSKKLVKPWVRGVTDNPLNVHPSRYISLCRPAAAPC